MNRLLLLAICLGFAACAPKQIHNLVTPLPAGYSAESLDDAFVPAKFTVADFDWTAGTLTAEIFSEDLYDMVDIHQLVPGDTIIYMGGCIVIDSIRTDDGTMEINGGLGEPGGAWLEAYEGGTWRAMQFDDHSVYTSIGTVSLPLSEDFTIVDCGQQYTDPCDTVRVNQGQYIEGLTAGKTEFTELNTKVLVVDGKINSIERRWIP